MSINRIETPYTLVAADKALIRDHFNGDPDDWDDPVFNPFRERLIQHNRPEQMHRCCYCKVRLRTRKQNADIDHIIPKSKHPAFSFKPKNLALSCKACNSSKSHKYVFSDPNIADESLERLPSSRNSYRIIHPHLDDYFEHIQILDDILIYPVTDKGEATYTYCDLHEPQLAIDKALEKDLDEDNIKNLFLRLVVDLPTDGFDLSEDIFDRIEEILDHLEN